MKTTGRAIVIVMTVVFAIFSGQASAGLIITYVENGSGVTGTITGNVPYSTVGQSSNNQAYADVGPDGNFGFGGTLTTMINSYKIFGSYSVDLSTLVDPAGWVDPTSVSGSIFYFTETSDYFCLDLEQEEGASVNSSIFFDGATLESLGITETSSTQITFTPDDTELDPFTMTFITPEPATLVMLAGGAVLLGLKRKRK